MHPEQMEFNIQGLAKETTPGALIGWHQALSTNLKSLLKISGILFLCQISRRSKNIYLGSNNYRILHSIADYCDIILGFNSNYSKTSIRSQNSISLENARTTSYKKSYHFCFSMWVQSRKTGSVPPEQSQNSWKFKLIRYLVFFCWFPFYMLRLLYNFTPWLNDRCPSFATFWYGSMALANINSCLNPILYAGLNTRFV